MSYTRPFGDREKALEDAFFREESERLLAEMRARTERGQQFESLSEVLGLREPAIIDPLLDLGLREENVTALVMAPLVAVAWADRTLDNEERRIILKAEGALDIDPKSEAGKLLSVWLEHRPHESLIDAWASYVHELAQVLPREEHDRLRDDIVGWSKRVAGAIEKSFLRGGGPTEEEQAVLARIEAAFETGADKKDPLSLDEATCSMT